MTTIIQLDYVIIVVAKRYHTMDTGVLIFLSPIFVGWMMRSYKYLYSLQLMVVWSLFMMEHMIVTNLLIIQ